MTQKRKPANLIYGVDDPVPLPTCLLLGLQHSFHVTTALIFALMVVKGMGGSSKEAGFFVGMSLLASGIATMLQAVNRKGIGSGYFAPLRLRAGLYSRLAPGGSERRPAPRLRDDGL